MAMEKELVKNLFEKPITLKFPFERKELVKGIRARVDWQIDKCIGCSLCVDVCPSGAIELLGKGRQAEIIYDISKCVFCGECVDICPTKTIYTTKQSELVFTRPKQTSIYFKRKNLGKKLK